MSENYDDPFWKLKRIERFRFPRKETFLDYPMNTAGGRLTAY